MAGAPVGARHFGHAAKQAFLGARAHQKLVAARHDERRPPALLAGFLRRLARKRLLIAANAGEAILVQRTERAGWLFRRADRGAEIHQRLGAVASARLLVASASFLVAGARFAKQRRSELLNERL